MTVATLPETTELITPYGGELKDLVVDASRAAELREEITHLPKWDLTDRQVLDIELLLNGGFSPLEGFMGRADYESVCRRMRLTCGVVWPMPITLDVTEEFAAGVSEGDRIALAHPEGMVLAVLIISDIWRPDRIAEAGQVFGTTDETHPGVFFLKHQTHPFYIGGRLEGLELPPYHTYQDIRLTPAQLRARFAARGWTNVVAFQTRNPLHRAHVELTRRAAEQAGAKLLIHPVVGKTRPGDIDYFVRVRCYKAVMSHYPENAADLSLLPLAMRMGGPREAVWHAIIRRNYGCNHLVIGRDHAGPGADADGRPFYGPYEAQELVREFEDEIGVRMVDFEEIVYVADEQRYMPASEAGPDAHVLRLSGTELRERLRNGGEIPEWFSYPDVLKELRREFPPRLKQGFTVFFTGLSGSGKSTVAQILEAKLMETALRPVTLLDGDLVRKHLSSELGFSKEHRDINIRRIGWVAGEITRNGGVAICAPIAPYDATRRQVREMIEPHGGYIEVYVSTPLEVCERRDRKGLYAKARAGVIKGFTGIDDPYEAPVDAEIVIDTTNITPEAAAQTIVDYLRDQGFINGADE